MIKDCIPVIISMVYSKLLNITICENCFLLLDLAVLIQILCQVGVNMSQHSIEIKKIL
jgi:hypothetical protein